MLLHGHQHLCHYCGDHLIGWYEAAHAGALCWHTIICLQTRWDWRYFYMMRSWAVLDCPHWQVPATKEVLSSLPNVFSALCLNARGLEAFVQCRPFDRLFKVLLSPDYLPAMRRRRSSDPPGNCSCFVHMCVWLCVNVHMCTFGMLSASSLTVLACLKNCWSQSCVLFCLWLSIYVVGYMCVSRRYCQQSW